MKKQRNANKGFQACHRHFHLRIIPRQTIQVEVEAQHGIPTTLNLNNPNSSKAFQLLVIVVINAVQSDLQLDRELEDQGTLHPQGEEPQEEDTQEEDPQEEDPQEEDAREETFMEEHPQEEDPQEEDTQEETPMEEDPQEEHHQHHQDPQEEDRFHQSVGFHHQRGHPGHPEA